MIFRKFLVASAIAAAPLVVAAPAAAQTALQAGAKVTDPQGGEVGTIASVDGDHVVLRTDRHEARIPVNSLTATDEAVLIGLTRDELNAQLDQMKAQMAEAVRVGAVVHDRDGAVVGPVEALDAETVTIKFGEQQFRLPRSAVAPAPNGLVIGASVAELRTQLGATAEASGN